MSRVGYARKAYRKRDLEQAKAYHTKEAISIEHHKVGKSMYLKDLVYGALDGIITTFAIVAGVTGATLSTTIILILGFANLIGDGISMAAGNYLGTRSEQDFYSTEKKREEWEIDNIPEGEREEIRAIYRNKGFRGGELEKAVKVVTSDKKVWVDEMMKDELGLMKDEKSPAKAGLATFLAFVFAGIVPLLSYVFATSFAFIQPYAFQAAIVLTAVTIFAVGSARSLVIGKKWYMAGLEMLVIGGLAAIAAFYIGSFASIIVGVNL